MSKVQKYYDYVINDMIDRTIVTDGRTVIFPYFPEDRYYDDAVRREGDRRIYNMDFLVYIGEQYGVSDEDMEAYPFYLHYIDGVISKIYASDY